MSLGIAEDKEDTVFVELSNPTGTGSPLQAIIKAEDGTTIAAVATDERGDPIGIALHAGVEPDFAARLVRAVLAAAVARKEEIGPERKLSVLEAVKSMFDRALTGSVKHIRFNVLLGQGMRLSIDDAFRALAREHNVQLVYARWQTFMEMLQSALLQVASTGSLVAMVESVTLGDGRIRFTLEHGQGGSFRKPSGDVVKQVQFVVHPLLVLTQDNHDNLVQTITASIVREFTDAELAFAEVIPT